MSGDPLEAKLKPAVGARGSWAPLIWIVAALLLIGGSVGFVFGRPKPAPARDPIETARQQLLTTLDESDQAETIRAAMQNYQGVAQSNSDAAEIWEDLDEARFVRDEQPVSDALKTRIREFAGS